MTVTFIEINRKEVDVPDNITLYELEMMVVNGDVVIGDTTDYEYKVMFPDGTEHRI